MHESPIEEVKRHFKARRNGAWTLAELLSDHGNDLPDEVADDLRELHDDLRPGTDREESGPDPALDVDSEKRS